MHSEDEDTHWLAELDTAYADQKKAHIDKKYEIIPHLIKNPFRSFDINCTAH